MQKNKILLNLFTITFFMLMGCGKAENNNDQALTAQECQMYRFNFADISEIKIPSDPFPLITNSKGIKEIDNAIEITYMGGKYKPLDVSSACEGFIAKDDKVKEIPDNCYVLLSPEIYWSAKPECAKINTNVQSNVQLNKNCWFLCSKKRCYTMLQTGYMLYTDTAEAQFDETTGIPHGFYEDDNICGHKYFQP